MRSFDDQTFIKRGGVSSIPDFKGAATGLTGVKAPFGYKQTDGIYDRGVAAGTIKPVKHEFKR